MRIRIGIIGSGRMGERHASAYRKIKNAEVMGFSDIDIKKSKKIAKRFKKRSYSVEAMLEDDSIDAVDVCTPNLFHAENTLSALRAGKHVMVEKPMAISLKDCDRMIATSKKEGFNLMVGHTYRFYPSSLKAKKIIDSGEIGHIRLVQGHGLDPGQIPGKASTPSWALKKETGGGVFFDAIHGIDLLRYWLNSDVSSVFVPLMDKIDESATAEQMGLGILTFKNGAVASIMPVAPTWGIRDTGVKLIGKKGTLYVTYGEEVKVGKKNWKHYSFAHQASKATYAHNLQGFINELSEFVSSIVQKRQPKVTGEDGKKNLKVILSMYESYKKGKIVNIS